MMSGGTRSQREAWQLRAIFAFGAFLIVVALATVIFVPHLTVDQRSVFRVSLAVGGAGVASIIPGFITFKWTYARQVLSAGGALAVFGLIYMIDAPDAGHEDVPFGNYLCTVDGRVMPDCSVQSTPEGASILRFRTPEDAARQVQHRLAGIVRAAGRGCVVVTLQRDFEAGGSAFARKDAGSLSLCPAAKRTWDGAWSEDGSDAPVKLVFQGIRR